ncbi:MAG: hypothetical protein ABSG36_14545 [Acidimicrobiales bacterium]
MTITEQSVSQRLGAQREHLFVRSLSVQGGEARFCGERTPYARIIMTGVDLEHAGSQVPVPRRQESAVLRLEHAAAFVADLRQIVNELVRSTPTPAVAANGSWSWSSVPPHAEELVVARADAAKTSIVAAAGARPTVRVDFTGTLVRGLASYGAPVHAQTAVFSSPRQVQALISSLKKVVNSSLAQRRLEVYVSAPAPVSTSGF